MKCLGFGLAGLLFGVFSPNAMAAGCRDGGFLYMWASCVQNHVSGQPENICEVREGENIETVLVTTNVFHDAPDNNAYPSSIFFDEAQLTQSLTISGRKSVCFDNPAEATDDLRHMQADWKRSMRGKIIFVTVVMPDT